MSNCIETQSSAKKDSPHDPGVQGPAETASQWEPLVMAMADAAVQTDAAHIIRNINPGFTRIFGYTAQEIVGKSAMALYAMADLFHEQVRLRFNPGARGAAGSYETRYRRKNGDSFSASSTGVRIRDRSGRVTGYALLIKDDQENRQMESDYIRLATAVDQATENVVITDASGTIEYVNPSFEKTTGYSRQEVLGKTPAILKSGAHDTTFYQEIWTTLLSGKPWSGRIKNRRKDGSLYTEDCIISPVFSGTGEIINFVGVKHDISRTLALEEQTLQSRRIESLGRLAGGVAHDINNLLFPILGYTEILLEDLPGTSLMREPIEEIRGAGIKVRNLVRQLLAFSRKQTLEIGPIQLNAVIQGFEKLMRKTVREDVEMIFGLEADLPLVMADLGQVEQILMNLVVNAQYAMPGGGRIEISTGLHDLDRPDGRDGRVKTGRFAYIRVSDTGHGMDEETCRRIFEPFFTTRPGSHGTGLGLSTVYGIVKQHKGHIDVESSPGKGACFTVSLPLAGQTVQAQDKPEQKQEGSESKQADLPGRCFKTVMLAEDHPIAIGYAAQALNSLGFDVVMAGDSLACREFLSQYSGDLDLLLTDVVMPGLNGPELQKLVQKKIPSVKTLFMSGYSHDVISLDSYLEKGLNFIAKPFSKQELKDKLAAMA